LTTRPGMPPTVLHATCYFCCYTVRKGNDAVGLIA
jgi:hypothetical protein